MVIAFVGGGNMATALIGGLLQSGWNASDIRAVDVSADARARLQREFNVAAHPTAAPAVTGADCVVLAVKPQQLREVAESLQSHVARSLVISIAAGIRSTDLSRWLGGHERVVRAMPNTPALVLAGITGLFAGASVSSGDRGSAEAILGVAGATVWVDREDQLDGVTAVSGSGPAYVFYFIEALQQAAAELGFDEKAARRLALETFSGAVKLALNSSEPPAVLRARVTSKGGTTERAVAALEDAAVKAAIVKAVHAAARRSAELGDELGRDK